MRAPRWALPAANHASRVGLEGQVRVASGRRGIGCQVGGGSVRASTCQNSDRLYTNAPLLKNHDLDSLDPNLALRDLVQDVYGTRGNIS